MRVLYCFRSELTPTTKWRCVELDDTPLWESMRYSLELKHLQTSRRHMWSYFDACLSHSLHTKLKTHDHVTPGSRLVLFRKPYPRALARTETHGGRVSPKGVYVPMTEDEKILVSMSSEFTSQKTDNLTHPSDYRYTGVTPIPPVGYVCLGCNTPEHHFRSDCPTDVGTQDACKSLDKVQRPHGIPKSQLRKVKECERGNAMKDDDGNYVIRVTKPTFTPVVPTPPSLPAPTKKEETVVRWCTDWSMADHFCITYSRRRGRKRKHTTPCEVEGEMDFDFERILENRDRQARKPVEKYNTVCTHWLRGMCTQGAECEFVHRMDQHLMPDCKFYKNGQCVSEDMCVFRHTQAPKVQHLCPRYVMGFCALGPKCHLDHVKRVEPLQDDFNRCKFRERSGRRN